MVVVTELDIARTQSTSVAVTTSSTQVLPTRLGRERRTQLIITNLSPTTLYLSKTDGEASSGQGIVLTQNGVYVESDDAGFRTYQGAIQGIATGATTVAVMESFEQ